MGKYLVVLVVKLGLAVAAAFALKAILGGITGGAALLKDLGGFGGLLNIGGGLTSGLGSVFGGVVRGDNIHISNERARAQYGRATGG